MLPARSAASTLALLVFLLTFVSLQGACGGGNTATETDTASAEQAEAEEDPEPPGKGDKTASGWRWKGTRQECFFRHRDRCFSTREAACRAARCAESKCAHNDAVPAVVTCRK